MGSNANPPMRPGKTKQAAIARWLDERGWTFAEMTEAQKLEMRRTWRICGAATAISHYAVPCVFTPYPENGRCRIHGGPSPKGIASPEYQGKGWSRYMPERWLPMHKESQEDPELLNMVQDIRLLDVRVKQLLQKMGTGDVGEAWIAMRGEWEKLQRALRVQDPKEQKRRVGEHVTAMSVLINRGSAEAEAWRELLEVSEQRTRVIERHTKQQMVVGALVAMEDAMTDYQALAMAVKMTVENTDLKRTKPEELLRAIATQFARIVGVEYLADTGAGNGGPGRDLAGGRARKALPGPRRVR
jgi:hypothetical protein